MAVDAVTVGTVGQRICALLGLDPQQTGRIEVIFQPDDIVIARVDHYLTNTQTEEFFDVSANGDSIHPPKRRLRSKRHGAASPEAAI